MGSKSMPGEKIMNYSIENINDPRNYINRELSLLEFQNRVFEEAVDPKNPLLERVKFLSIVDSNMDEFFMIRAGSIMMQNDAGIAELSIDGLTPAEQLAEIRKVAIKFMQQIRNYLHEQLKPELKEVGIHILDYHELAQNQKDYVDGYFHDVIFPVLTPLAFDPGHPFPHISNLSLNVAVLIEDEHGQMHFARLKVPVNLPYLIPLKRSSGGTRKDGTVPHRHYFVWLSQVIIENLGELFPGMRIVEAHPFHVTRNSDIEIQELEALDLLETMEDNVRRRRFGKVVRLMIDENMPDVLKKILVRNLNVDEKDIYSLKSPLSLRGLSQITTIDRYDLRDRTFFPAIPKRLRNMDGSEKDSIFSRIRNGDILLHHPYESFIPVIDFINLAARDPNVLAIKQTLYRVGRNSPVVNALLKARRDYGKQVAVLVELKARFDEESNIEWAKKLEQEGVHVIYGLLGLKTHSKIALVVRNESGSIRRYLHLATGNYNHVTALLYEDMGMFTCDDAMGADASDLFNYLTGYSSKQDYRKLLVAPINLRQRFEELILNETKNADAGKPAHLIFKCNSLVDKPIISLLYQASQAGVKVDLLVRGICALRPGIPGLSENIRVMSIVGRFLEHSRIYYFLNGGDEIVLLGSADLMPRNLNTRVEVLFPVEDKKLINHIRNTVLSNSLSDTVKMRIMEASGNYKRLALDKNLAPLNSQEWLIDYYHHSEQ
jgi:polyphosphate kinase